MPSYSYRITQYTGSATRPAEVSGGDPDHERVILVKEDGSQVAIFTGDKFSEDEWKEKMKGRKSFLVILQESK